MYKKIILCILLLFFANYGFADTQKRLTIGVSATYTGALSSVGKHVSDGMVDYLKWIASHDGIEFKNPKTGKTDKISISVLVEDNQYNAVKSAIAYQQLKARGANVIIGFGSTPGEACAASASKDKLPYLSWYAYASPAGFRPKPQYYWTFLPTIAESATPMIKWFVTKKWQGAEKPKIGIIALDIPSWQVLGKPGLMSGYLEGIGGKLAGIEFVSPKKTDLSLPLRKLVFEKKADCIIVIGVLTQTVFLAKSMQQLGIDPEKTVVISNLSAWDESLFKSVPKAVDGLYGEVYTVSVEENIPGMEKVKAVAEWAGRNPNELVINYANGCMGAFVLECAIKRALEKHGYKKVIASGEMIRNELHQFQSFDPLGLAPPIEVKHPDQPYFLNYARIVRAKNGKFEDAGDWISVDRIAGTLEY